VTGHNWLVSPRLVNALHVTWNKTLNDRPMPKFFSPTEVGSTVVGAIPGYMGVSVTNGFSFGTGGTNPGLFQLERVPGRQRRRLAGSASTRYRSAATGSTRASKR
jgi:hypothetical protein